MDNLKELILKDIKEFEQKHKGMAYKDLRTGKWVSRAELQRKQNLASERSKRLFRKVK